MEGARRLAVVVVNYRTAELTCEAVASLAGEIDPARDLAVVVDNASGDGSADAIESHFRDRGLDRFARVLRSEQNGGFGAGNNLGVRAAPADWYLLLNSDARLAPGALGALLAEGARDPGLGLLGPRIVGPDGEPHTSCFRYPSPLSQLIDAAGSGPVTKGLARWNVPLPPDATPVDPDWISFACVLVRAAAWAAAGGFDEGYFLYYEDVDFCRAARRAGWRIGFVPEARAVHLHGASTRVPDARARRTRAPAYLYDSRARYFTKVHGRSGLLAANVLWSLGRLVALARERLGSKVPHAVAAEWRDIWRGRPGARSISEWPGRRPAR
ncbi:MAG TPA: glycosyltransferase family 2 protein [Myxococcota bacterium]|nr:glycosyltransferase family 2 protein [Myxococcota bacterium]